MRVYVPRDRTCTVVPMAGLVGPDGIAFADWRATPRSGDEPLDSKVCVQRVVDRRAMVGMVRRRRRASLQLASPSFSDLLGSTVSRSESSPHLVICRSPECPNRYGHFQIPPPFPTTDWLPDYTVLMSVHTPIFPNHPPQRRSG